MPFAPARNGKARRRKTAFEQEAELTAIAQDTGVEPEKPGILTRALNAPLTRTVIDLISRGEYASAGVKEELAAGGSPMQVIGRAGREVFSGLPGVQGEKKSYTQLLEEGGVGTRTLSELMPFLEGTWVGSFGSRGALGLAEGVLLDPTTYLSLGASAVAKVPFRSGTRLLSKAGREELAALRTGVRGRFVDELDDAVRKGDAVKLVEIERKIDDAAEDEFLAKWVDNDDTLPAALSDPGGIKFAGLSVIPGSTIHAAKRETADLIRAVPGGKAVAEATTAFSRGLADMSAQLLSPFAALRPLKHEQRVIYDRAMQLHRDATHARTAVHQRLRSIAVHGDENLGIAPGMRERWSVELGADETLGNKLYSIRENVPDPATGKRYSISDLKPGQVQLLNDFAKLFDHMGQTLIEHGILTADELGGSYFPHFYENLEELREIHPVNPRRYDNRIAGSFMRERVFDTYDDAVRTTRTANEVGKRAMLSARGRRGLDPAVRPELKPRYDLLENYDTFIGKYADALARNSWTEQVIQEFGTEIGRGLRAEDLWKIKTWDGSYAGLPTADVGKIAKFFQGGAKVSPLEKSWQDLLDDEAAVIGKAGRTELEASLMTRAAETLRGLTPTGRQTMMNRLLSAITSESHATTVVRDLYDEFAESFPSWIHSSDDVASLSYEKMYGAGVKPVIVESSVLTGGKPIRIPAPLFDDMTRIDGDVLLDRTKNEGLRTLIRGWDKFNALFRLGVYGMWIPSYLRDAYNNVALSMFDIGLGSMKGGRVKRAVEIMAGRDGILRTPSGDYTYQELRALAAATGVGVPGRVFAEGLAAGESRLARGLGKVAEARATVDNTSRMMLWLGNIERGVAPRDAARHVTDFLFDYNEISPFFRGVLRRFYAFPTFTLKNVPFWVRELRRNPGLAANQLKPFRARKDEREALADWQADQLRIRLDKDGRTLHVLQGIDLPVKNLDTLWAGGFGKTGRLWMSMLAPIPRTALEVIPGTNLMTGRPMSRVQGQTIGRLIDSKVGGVVTPDWLKTWIGYDKTYDTAGRPRYTFNERKYALLVRSWMFSRIVSSSDRVWRDQLNGLDKSALQGMLESAVLGIRYNEIDLDQATLKKIESRVYDLRQKIREQTSTPMEELRRRAGQRE